MVNPPISLSKIISRPVINSLICLIRCSIGMLEDHDIVFLSNDKVFHRKTSHCKGSGSVKSRIFAGEPPGTPLLFHSVINAIWLLPIHNVLNAIWLPQCWGTIGAPVINRVICF